jgi:hypothetical protein
MLLMVTPAQFAAVVLSFLRPLPGYKNFSAAALPQGLFCYINDLEAMTGECC